MTRRCVLLTAFQKSTRGHVTSQPCQRRAESPFRSPWLKQNSLVVSHVARPRGLYISMHRPMVHQQAVSCKYPLNVTVSTVLLTVLLFSNSPLPPVKPCVCECVASETCCSPPPLAVLLERPSVGRVPGEGMNEAAGLAPCQQRSAITLLGSPLSLTHIPHRHHKCYYLSKQLLINKSS